MGFSSDSGDVLHNSQANNGLSHSVDLFCDAENLKDFFILFQVLHIAHLPLPSIPACCHKRMRANE
jgi:hypothetical protein